MFCVCVMRYNSYTVTLLETFAASLKVLLLQDISRIVVRRILRRNIQIENPNIDQKLPRRQKKLPDRQHRINLMPLETGLMVMNQLTDSESDPENEDQENEAEETGRQIVAGEDTRNDEIRDHVFPSLLFPPPSIGHGKYVKLQRNVEGEEAATSEEPPLEVDNGFVEGHDDQEVDSEGVYCDEAEASKAGSETICIRNRKTTSSSNGFSASYSSGIGTCSSLDVESIALDSQFSDDADGTSCDAINGNGRGDLPVWDLDFDMAVADDTPAYWPKADSPSPQTSVFRSTLDTFAASGPSYEPPLQCPEEETRSTVQEAVVGGNEGKEKPPSSGTMYRALLRQKILALPIPVPLKNFLLFYRK